MSGVLLYWPADDHGRGILDRMESKYEVPPTRTLDDGAREYYVVAAGPVSLNGWLDAIDPNWRAHIEPRTEHAEEERQARRANG